MNVLVPSKFSVKNVVAVGLLGLATRLLLLPVQTVEGVAVSDGVAGKGFTITVAVSEVAAHPLPAIELTVNVTVTGEEVVLVREPLMSVVPLAAIPVTVPVLFLVQL